MSPTPIYPSRSRKRSGLLTALVAGALIALVAANVYLYVQIDHLRTDVAKVRETLSTELSNLRDASSVTTASQRRHIETLKAELEAARIKARAKHARCPARPRPKRRRMPTSWPARFRRKKPRCSSR